MIQSNLRNVAKWINYRTLIWLLISKLHFFIYRYVAPLITTVYFCGVMLGGIIFGSLSDRYGRKYMMLVCLYTQCLIGVGLHFVRRLVVFIGLRFIQGIFIQVIWKDDDRWKLFWVFQMLEWLLSSKVYFIFLGTAMCYLCNGYGTLCPTISSPCWLRYRGLLGNRGDNLGIDCKIRSALAVHSTRHQHTDYCYIILYLDHTRICEMASLQRQVESCRKDCKTDRIV